MSHWTSRARVLIIDDQVDILASLQLLLKSAEYETDRATTPQAALAAVRSRHFDAVLMDLNYAQGSTSGREGLDLLLKIRELDSDLPVILMTAWGTIELAVEAMRRGARDFVEKPWNNERLLRIIQTQIQLSRAIRQSRQLEEANRLLKEEEQAQFIAESQVMQPVLQMIARIGPSDANVLITGENGSGKGLIAGLLHAGSPRAHRQMITVDVGGLSEGVFESEMFGHTKGAFTDAKSDRAGRLEIADGGTLFLDEIANISPSVQAKLLRVIEAGEYEPVGSSKTRRADVRLISATNADLNEHLENGRFRRDLLYRLNTVEIHVPPLRERCEDIPLLAMHFLSTFRLRYRKNVSRFDSGALEVMREYLWPGNVRELAHTVERAVLMADGEQIRPSDLGLGPVASNMRPLEEMSFDEIERVLIRKALKRFGGNVSRAAGALGLSRSALYRRIDKHGL